MMALNPLLKKLVEQSAAKYSLESDLNRAVRREVQKNLLKVIEGRSRLFTRRTMPPASVLARLESHDRDAVIAHFRAKELRCIADARNRKNDYDANLAIKRLYRVNEMAESFAEVDREGRHAA